MMEQTDIETIVEGQTYHRVPSYQCALSHRHVLIGEKAIWRSWCWEGGSEASLSAYVKAHYSEPQRIACFGRNHFCGGYPGFIAKVGTALGAQSALHTELDPQQLGGVDAKVMDDNLDKLEERLRRLQQDEEEPEPPVPDLC